MLHPCNELLGATHALLGAVAARCAWQVGAVAPKDGDPQHQRWWRLALQHMRASVVQLQVLYPPESVALALQQLMYVRAAMRASTRHTGGVRKEENTHVQQFFQSCRNTLQHHFGHSFVAHLMDNK